jgi:hypothetical protein
MQIPTLNPLRFYKPNATKLKDNLSFADSSDYWNDLPGAYTPKFQDQTENVIYQSQISGVYGFSSIEEFITSGATNPSIENCQMCIDSGSIIYTNLDGAVTGKKLILKVEGDYSVEVREDTTVVALFNDQSGIFTYTLAQSYTNLTVKISSTLKICVLGVMLCEPEIDYKVCNYDAKAELIDSCGVGGVYLLTSNIKWYNLNNDISEKLSVYSFDFTGSALNPVQSTNYRIKIGSVDILEFVNSANGDTDEKVLNAFVLQYEWIDYTIDGLILTVTLPKIVGAVFLLKYNLSVLINTYSFTLDSEYIDEDFVYTSKNDNYIDETGTDINIFVSKIGFMGFRIMNYYQAYGGINEAPITLSKNTFYTTNGNTIDFLDESPTFINSSYVQISKKGQIYGQCCRFEVGDYYSEYFTIITEAQKQSLKLLNLTYSSEFMDLNVAFSSLWTAGLLVNAQLLKGSGSDIEVFVGQQSNTNLENFSKRIRVFKTGAIPDYLSDMLSNIFGFDTIQIEGENYAAEEGPEESQFEERTDLFQLEIILRKQNFDFLI